MSVTIDNNKKLRLHRNASSNITKKQATNKLKDKLLLPDTLEGELISVMYMGSDNKESGLLGYRTKSNYVIFDGVSSIQEDGTMLASDSNKIEVKREGDNFVIYQGGQVVPGSTIPANTASAISDFFLRSGEFNSTTKKLTLTVGDGNPANNQTVVIPANELFKTYTAGNGIEISSNGEISVKIANGSKLQSGANGLSVDLSEYVKTDNQAFRDASTVANALKDALPTGAGANNKLVTQQDLAGYQPSTGTQQPQVVPSNGSQIGVVKGETSDSYDVVTTNGNIKVKLASGIVREEELEDAVENNALRRSKSGGLHLSTVWDCGEY